MLIKLAPLISVLWNELNSNYVLIQGFKIAELLLSNSLIKTGRSGMYSTTTAALHDDFS